MDQINACEDEESKEEKSNNNIRIDNIVESESFEGYSIIDKEIDNNNITDNDICGDLEFHEHSPKRKVTSKFIMGCVYILR